MFRTFCISFSLKNTYRVNTILFSLKQIPLLKRLLPEALYQSRGLKKFALILSVFWEVAGALAGKALYLFCMVFWQLLLYGGKGHPELYCHMFFFLTLIGAYMNTYMFNPTNDKYYAMILMGMDARQYTLSNYWFQLIRSAAAFLPFLILTGSLAGIPLWPCFLSPLLILAVKLSGAWYFLRRYEKTGSCSNENLPSRTFWILTAVFLGAAYVLPAFGICLPISVYTAAVFISLIPGVRAAVKISGFRHYREMYQILLAEKRTGMDVRQTVRKAVAEQSLGNISRAAGTGTNRSGFAGFHDLFVKRHKKILWKSVKRLTAVLLAGTAALLAAVLSSPRLAPAIRSLLLEKFPYIAFLMYLLNRGTVFTQALFMSCDHSMLTYSFYKRPACILELFRLRLLEIIRLNLMPAAVLAAGLPLLLWMSGGTENFFYYILYPASILAMSIFFSVHYLTLYYLLQPYTASTELKSGTYKLAVWATYLVCFLLLQFQVPALLFGILSLVFSLVYSGIACILVYRMAGRTFRLRS